MKHCRFLFFGLLFLTSCVIDSDDDDMPKPDSTHTFVVSVNKIATSECNSDGIAEINTKIEIFISTRDEGEPRRPDFEKDFPVTTFNGFGSQNVSFELEADFALDDDVLVLSKITSYDARSSIDFEEEFWHRSYYSAEQDCWYNANSFANPFDGCRGLGGDTYEYPHQVSWTTFECIANYEYTAGVEKI